MDSRWPLYFAYGSNLLGRRMRIADRAPGAVLLGAGTVAGYSLRFHKRGADGSGKCDLVVAGGAEEVHAWGAVWRLCEDTLQRLDRSEGPGYRRATVDVELGGETVHATTYLAVEDAIDASLEVFDWYRAIVAAGAREVGLPAAWVRGIEAQPVRRDPDEERRARFLALLP